MPLLPSYTHVDDRPALCKMPLLTTDDSIITLRKSYYLRRAICRATPRRNVVAVCVRAYNNNNDAFSNNERLRNLADTSSRPQATRDTQSQRVSRIYILRQGRCYAYACPRYLRMWTRRYTLLRILAWKSKLRRLAWYHRISVNSRGGSILSAKDSEGDPALLTISRSQYVTLYVPKKKNKKTNW